MKLLLTGNLSFIAASLNRRLIQDTHSVVSISSVANIEFSQDKEFPSFSFTTDSEQYEELFRSHSFDLVIFNIAQENLIREDDRTNNFIAANELQRTLELCQKYAVEKFLLISSLQVYGDSSNVLEDQIPKPSTVYGHSLLNAETMSRFYCDNFNIKSAIVRLPLVYGQEEINSLIHKIVKQTKGNQKIIINADAETSCSFIQIEELSNFFSRLINEENWQKFEYFNLVGETINFQFLHQLFTYYLPKADISFEPDGSQFVSPIIVQANNALEKFNWITGSELLIEFPTLLEQKIETQAERISFMEKIKTLRKTLHPFLIWGEVILGAFLMHMLTIWTDTLIEFKYIDYRLLYVVIIGSTHGLLFGILASLLAATSMAVSWFNIGLDWALLIYNVENWMPFALMFLAGAVTGYLHDKQENDSNFEKQQTELIHEKYEFLYKLYDETNSLKNRLREQLVGYRDSFGRFYKITNELNDLDEDSIFFKALDILEEVMQNSQIAIYTIESTGQYGRLEVKSKELTQSIPKSLKLVEYSQAEDDLQLGNIFQNKELLPNYPAYIAPIMNQGSLIGLVVLWEAQFEQFNMYYLNLFKVISGLIQSSLVRAALFRNTQLEQLYISQTSILKPEAFKRVYEMKKKMKRNKVLDFQVMQIPREEMSWKELSERITKVIRDEDVIGVAEEDDSKCYAILSHAGIENIPAIQERLAKNELNSNHVFEIEGM